MNTFLAVEEVHVGVILLCMRSRITFFSRFSDYSFAVCVLIPFFIPDVKQTDSLLEGDEAEDPSHNSCLRRCLRRGSGGGCRAAAGAGWTNRWG